MKTNLRRTGLLLVLGGFLGAAPTLAFGNERGLTGTQAYLERQVRHELLMLPYYGVFDNLEYRIDGDHVKLLGEVRWSTLKSSAENVVKRIEGVKSVTNDIKVLPLSSFDDRTRLAVYRALFGGGPLFRYSMGANPSIHIIVDNGKVTLEGVVGSQMDRNIATLRASGVPAVFFVVNNLRVES